MNIQEAYLLIIESENFKNWFGKSVLHTKGAPHTLYHGTDSDIAAFSHDHIGKGNDEHGAGFYFSDDPKLASNYTNHGKDGGNVIPVHLKVEKPIYTHEDKPFTRTQITKIIASAPNYKDSLANFGDVDFEGHYKVLQKAVDQYEDIPKHRAIHSLKNDFYQSKASEFLTALTKHTGHDSVIHKPHKDLATIVNVFHPNQIKSAIGNSGEYSKYSSKINESRK
jgi:hypothetical protein